MLAASSKRSLRGALVWFFAAPLAALHAQCQVLKLVGPAPAPYEFQFGRSVSLRSDRLAVGVPGGLATGSAHVFELGADGAWIRAATLLPSDGEIYDEFGYSVAIDGDTVVVGATDHGTLGAKGAAYLFERQSDGAWIETQKLIPPSDAWAFGWAVDLEGDRLVVGAKGASDLSGGKGMALVYERESGVWVKKATVKPTISAPGDGFGADLDLQGERLVVGASYNWTLASPNEGLAFVFERHPSGILWSQKAMLAPDDIDDLDLFGWSVALDGDRVAVGSMLHGLPTPFVGAIYIYEFVDGAWTQTAKLTPSDMPLLTEFATSAALEGDRLVVGAKSDSVIASGSGAAYFFEDTPSGWVEVAKFYGSGTAIGDTFGYCVTLDGGRALIGAPNATGSTTSPGYAFLFELTTDGPRLTAVGSEASLSAGGAQALSVGACSAHAGDIYAIAGSASGTNPGFTFDGISVPLNLDAYFLYTLNHAGAPTLTGAVGLLDENGFAQASFAIPPGTSPSLAGLTLHHAYAVLDGATLQVEAASPAVPVNLAP